MARKPGALAFAAVELDPDGRLWDVTLILVEPDLPISVIEVSEYKATGRDDLKSVLLAEGTYPVTGLAVDLWLGVGLANELSPYIPDVALCRLPARAEREAESTGDRNHRRALAMAERYLTASTHGRKP
ncbi:hypothetical protein ACFVFS_17340 [Kitasatospora sp. NPDC057692]|uniref:hypothetical protein n=1 Tax=Kitasatospora sp. NPDC057692 TaxID=3346215 RepID=UPI0036CA4E01